MNHLATWQINVKKIVSSEDKKKFFSEEPRKQVPIYPNEHEVWIARICYTGYGKRSLAILRAISTVFICYNNLSSRRNTNSTYIFYMNGLNQIFRIPGSISDGTSRGIISAVYDST